MNLLRVAVEDSLDVGLRQVAAITFKNLVRKEWDPSGAAWLAPAMCMRMLLQVGPCASFSNTRGLPLALATATCMSGTASVLNG